MDQDEIKPSNLEREKLFSVADISYKWKSQGLLSYTFPIPRW